MRILWSVLALLLLAGAWALRDPVITDQASCEAPPRELLDRARQDDAGPVKSAGSTTDGRTTADSAPRSTVDSSAEIAAGGSTVPSGSPSSARPAPSSASLAAMPPGAGTERQPFRVSWELLGRASGHVRGDGSLDAMPRTLELLGGTWIELSGYYSPAVIAPSTDEVVITLNRWDGCCIGLPPTPYDSALVKTRTPIDFSLQHQIRFGTLRGRLVLEPFALGGLVLGLYRIEDAELLR